MDTRKIARYLYNGRTSINWYQDCNTSLKRLFPGEDVNLIIELLAATSINTALPANVTLFFKAREFIRKGILFGDLAVDVVPQKPPVTVSKTDIFGEDASTKIWPTKKRVKGEFHPSMLSQLIRVQKGLGVNGPKIMPFARAMKGDPDAVVVDLWIVRAFGKEDMRDFRGRAIQNSPSMKVLREIIAYIREEAPAMGLQPRQMQSMIWAGIRGEQSSAAEVRYDKYIERRMHQEASLKLMGYE